MACFDLRPFFHAIRAMLSKYSTIALAREMRVFQPAVRLLASFGLILACSTSHAQGGEAEDGSMLLFDFEGDTGSGWAIVNDGVMGGRSKGYRDIVDGVMRFDGTLVTRGGGFTSVRTAHSVDLSGFDGLEMRVRGNGRSFEVEVNDGQRYGWRSVSRRMPFDTSEDWRVVRAPFSDLRSTVFGEPVSVPEIDLESVEQLGFYILDGIDGPFWLEVDRVSAYRDDERTSESIATITSATGLTTPARP